MGCQGGASRKVGVEEEVGRDRGGWDVKEGCMRRVGVEEEGVGTDRGGWDVKEGC